MNQFLADNIDQLDLALDQLAVGDRNFDRFALMLVDNVVELTLHRFVQDKAGENELWSRLREPKHDPKIVAQGLTQNFESKAKAACKLGLLDGTVCESILNLHAYRNTAYHKGLRHERILHSLVLFYFRNACALLKAYKPRHMIFSSADKISHRALKYLGDTRLHDRGEVFAAAYARLDCVAASMPGDLVKDLSDDLARTVDRTDETLEFLATEGRQKCSRDQAVIDAQAWPFAFTDDAKGFAAKNGCNAKTVGAYVEWIAKNYRWPVKKDPISAWRARLSAVRREKDHHKALKRYCDFMRQTENLRAQLSDAGAHLDAYIQEQIDVARGK